VLIGPGLTIDEIHKPPLFITNPRHSLNKEKLFKIPRCTSERVLFTWVDFKSINQSFEPYRYTVFKNVIESSNHRDRKEVTQN